MSTTSTTHTPAPVATAPTPPAPTKLAPWPAVRLSDGPDPYALPEPKEGEEIPPVMITQDVAGSRTISTMYKPSDQEPPVVTPPGGSTGETPVTTTVAIDAATIAGLSTTPKLLVAVPAGASLEFQGATGQYTYGTATYTGSGILQIKCGGVVVSDDVAVTPLTGAVSGPITFTALPGIALAPDQPITLTQSGGSLVGGDGTISLDVTTSTHLPDPPAGDAASASAYSAAPSVQSASAPPSTLAPRSAQPGHALGIRKGSR